MFLLRLILGVLAVAVSSVRTGKVPGDEKWTETDVTFDNKYVTGGEPVTAADLGLNRVTGGFVQVKNPGEAEATPINNAFFDVANMKVKLFNGKTSKELASEADASKVVVRVFAFGK
jgi:hypothetical protein